MSQDQSRIYIPGNSKSAPTPQKQYETSPSQPAIVAYRSAAPSGQQQQQQQQNYHQQQQRAQPRYSTEQQQRQQGRETTSSTHPSMQSDRSIYIGFDPSYDYGAGTGAVNNESSGVIPRFPKPVPNQQQQRQQQQRSSADTVPQPPPPPPPPQPSSRRTAASSFYSQQTTMQVSPIPEEPSLSRHDSYASSAAIPSGWDPDEADSFSSDEHDNALPIRHDRQDNEPSLVRQASLGKRHKPTMTEIRSPERSRSRAGTTSAAVIASAAGSATRKNSPPQTTMSSGSGAVPKVSPPASITTPSPLSQPPLAADSEYFPGSQPGPSSSRVPGRRVPPRLNMDAVRDAEARGSLTSLPDLIRRATKLAAVLETGRPGSTAWGGRGSFFGFNTESSTNRSRDRETDSISDILASFPPPALGGPQTFPQRMSQWPASGVDGYDDNGSLRPVKSGRRICGLPLWAFIILVILGLVVITAAVVVPIQLVNINKTRNASTNSNASILARCKESNPCQNGGENIANSDLCSCICTNGFTGASCETKGEDSSCTSFDFADQGGVEGIKNATIGSALPRLFNKSQASYDITLDPSLILGVFSKGNLSCTLQNALVSFNGRTEPTTTTATRRRSRRQLLTDTTLPVVPTATATAAGTPSASAAASREVALDQDAVDFARVAVLFLAQTEDIATAEAAHQALDDGFGRGKDFGNVTTGDITFRLDDRSVVLDDGSVVGGV
ncbi:hypothetical protein BZA05DRAFT_342088 [Tricharina praecox]|uniref:uncharacterized protein n=1 Tax=Tricharina praecox TaxID=43433 RepID=UPI00221F5BBF|nr:uncharacterized protein BZA05DRAFT_342088 [Tricharina praecox]KAI5846003.1 hypothetical protein BZA05DRAFT_342088 [Tricharina praecox]